LQHFVLPDHEILVAAHHEQTVAAASEPVARSMELKMWLKSAVELEGRVLRRPATFVLVTNSGDCGVKDGLHARFIDAVPSDSRRQQSVIVVLQFEQQVLV
jgi:hypothetical protein